MLAGRPGSRLALTLALSLVPLHIAGLQVVPARAQERLPWEAAPPTRLGAADYGRADDAYRPSRGDAYRPGDAYRAPGSGEVYVAPPPGSPGAQAYDGGPRYTAEPPPGYRRDGYGEPYERGYGDPYERGYGAPPPPYHGEPPPGYDRRYEDPTYSRNEILGAGHRFFGSVSRGLADVVEYAFQKAGRPNGYILGEDAGGAFVAGLRYGEGMLYTKNAGVHKVYWQGPSIGYDFGGEGSKTMVLVYNLRDPYEIYDRFAGVQGSAYIVGGVGVQFQKNGEVVLAPIRSGIGLRLGANIGYLKYTRAPTWNPF